MKPESHKSVTNLALDIYMRETSQSKLSDAIKKPRFKNALILGTIEEDGYTYSRGTNWHFYPANDTIKVQKYVLWKFPEITIYPTSKRIIKSREGEFISSLKDGASEALFTIFGRILHHIHDMSTPSHVVPVYHGPDKKDSYEDFLVDYWNDLEQQFTAQGVLEIPQAEPVIGFESIYEKAADRMLKCLKSEESTFDAVIDNVPQKADVSLFWYDYNPTRDNSKDVLFDIPGFGYFGPMGGNYGKSESIDAKGRLCQIDSDVYSKLAVLFTKHAVMDTLRALHAFEALVMQQFCDRPFYDASNPHLDDDEG